MAVIRVDPIRAGWGTTYENNVNSTVKSDTPGQFLKGSLPRRVPACMGPRATLQFYEGHDDSSRRNILNSFQAVLPTTGNATPCTEIVLIAIVVVER